jgi:hypothetical protein
MQEDLVMSMSSSLISKVHKAKLYANDPARIQFQDFTLTVRGDNDTHTITLRDGTWHCTCRTFRDDTVCAHTMAVERVLSVTIPADVRQGEPFSASGVHASPLL